MPDKKGAALVTGRPFLCRLLHESHDFRVSPRQQRNQQVGQYESRERKWRRKMIVGYARVSTEGQTLEAQLEQLNAAGATKIFSEKISGAQADNRKALASALKALGRGDVLVVSRLDRLARSTLDLLSILDRIGKAGAGFKSLGLPGRIPARRTGS
jgi:hypothetical protein